MRADEFASTLQAAIAGSHEALEKILELYAPLVRKHAYFNGTFDEDLHQYLLMHIALNIHKFIP